MMHFQLHPLSPFTNRGTSRLIGYYIRHQCWDDWPVDIKWRIRAGCARNLELNYDLNYDCDATAM